MLRIIYILFLIAGISFSQPAEKYFIYFKDKGIENNGRLEKNSMPYQTAVASLSERSIQRRKKTMGENFITYEDLPVNTDYIDEVKSNGVKIIRKLKWFNSVSAYLTAEQFEKIKQLECVDKIEKVKRIRYDGNPDERKALGKTETVTSSNYKYDYGSSLTQYELSDIPQVHNLGYTGNGVVIGLLDAGFKWQQHVATKGRTVIAEHDFVYGDSDTDDNDASHGTAVFSLIAGFDEGRIVGPAFGAKYILAKTEDIRSETHVEEDNYAAALEWMDSIGVDITSSSLGYNLFDDGEGDYSYKDMDGKTTIVTKAAELAFERGILTVTSAGNEGNNSWKYITAPADGINIIAVGAVNSSGVIASFSSRGPSYDGRIKPELVAMGVSCFHAVAYSSDTYGIGSGTSYSAPILAGMAGQLLSAFPYLNNKQMRTILIESGNISETPNNDYGYGLLSVLKAVQFPNIEKNDSTYTLHKIIVDSSGVDPNKVSFYYRVNSGIEYGKLQMQNAGKPFAFKVSLLNESLLQGDTVKFYFNYADSNGVVKRIPATKDYKIIYDSRIVALSSTPTPPAIPEKFELKQNYPNPFNPSTVIEYSIPQNNSGKMQNVRLVVYDILGRKVATLVNKYQSSGNYKIKFNAKGLSSGVYIYRLQSGNFNASKKMIYLR